MAFASAIRSFPFFAAFAMRAVAQDKLTAVGLAASSAALAVSMLPPLKSASEYPAKIPMAGAPRILSFFIASMHCSRLFSVMYFSSFGSRVWSSILRLPFS